MANLHDARHEQVASGRDKAPVGHQGHGGHSWLMMVCCIPMLVIAGILVATGVVSVGFLFVAVLCTVMMAMMMRTMGGMGGAPGSKDRH